jgi:SAM-dependent methyltransferase
MTAWCTGDRDHVPDGRGFMSASWDAFVPPPAVWDECLRVLKPGGHLLCFAGTRLDAAKVAHR